MSLTLDMTLQAFVPAMQMGDIHDQTLRIQNRRGWTHAHECTAHP